MKCKHKNRQYAGRLTTAGGSRLWCKDCGALFDYALLNRPRRRGRVITMLSARPRWTPPRDGAA